MGPRKGGPHPHPPGGEAEDPSRLREGPVANGIGRRPKQRPEPGRHRPLHRGQLQEHLLGRLRDHRRLRHLVPHVAGSKPRVARARSDGSSRGLRRTSSG